MIKERYLRIIVATLLAMPFASFSSTITINDPYSQIASQDLINAIFQQSEELGLTSIAPEIDRGVAKRALDAMSCATEEGQQIDKLLVVDMNMPARTKRLWAFDVSDLDNPVLITRDYVAHGSGSDISAKGRAAKFSNIPDSNMTSLGLYRIAEKYQGKNGWSRRLDGLFARFNSKARDRAVVLHPSNYVRDDYVGRSQGCPAVNQRTMDKLEKAGLSNAYLYIDGQDEELQSLVSACAEKRRARLLAEATRRLEDSYGLFAVSLIFNDPAASSGFLSWALPDSEFISTPIINTEAACLIDRSRHGLRLSV
ncbi:TPA: murein L,D-transpeptidase catalytic domain family protein [Stenotrophomonas maltophilia]